MLGQSRRTQYNLNFCCCFYWQRLCIYKFIWIKVMLGQYNLYFCCCFYCSLDTRVGLMLGQRRRRWPNINTRSARICRLKSGQAAISRSLRRGARSWISCSGILTALGSKLQILLSPLLTHSLLISPLSSPQSLPILSCLFILFHLSSQSYPFDFSFPQSLQPSLSHWYTHTPHTLDSFSLSLSLTFIWPSSAPPLWFDHVGMTYLLCSPFSLSCDVDILNCCIPVLYSDLGL